MKHLTFYLANAFVALSSPALSQTILSGAHSITGDVCLGSGFCTDSEFFGVSDFKVKSSFPVMLFEDSSPSSAATTKDWSLQGNDASDEFFRIRDEDTDNDVFYIEGGARDNALFIESTGDVGLGTSLPQADLHIVDDVATTLRMEETDSNQIFTNFVTNLGWFISNSSPGAVDSGSGRLGILSEAPASALMLQGDRALFNGSLKDYDFSFKGLGNTLLHGDAGTGNVGVGTATPDAPFEVSSEESFNFFRLTAQTAPLNKSVDIVYTKGPDDRGQLRYNIVEAGDSPQVPEMTLNADGDMVLTGTLTTMGPTCAAGCDRVFDEGFALPSIEEHAAFMWDNQHLAAVGATSPEAPYNLTEKTSGILHELEVAHIYIEELHKRLSAEQIRNDRQAQLISQMGARLDRVEAQ